MFIPKRVDTPIGSNNVIFSPGEIGSVETSDTSSSEIEYEQHEETEEIVVLSINDTVADLPNGNNVDEIVDKKEIEVEIEKEEEIAGKTNESTWESSMKKGFYWIVNKLFPTQQRYDPDDPFIQQTLIDMGFTDNEHNVEVLHEFEGVIPRVIDHLLSSDNNHSKHWLKLIV